LAVLIGSSLAAVLGFPFSFYFCGFLPVSQFSDSSCLSKNIFITRKKFTPQYYFPFKRLKKPLVGGFLKFN